ncbi:hypothetical protein FKM82_004199 [Ascaphus truei]
MFLFYIYTYIHIYISARDPLICRAESGVGLLLYLKIYFTLKQMAQLCKMQPCKVPDLPILVLFLKCNSFSQIKVYSI